MAQVIVSPEARKDLISIRAYIRDELSNPTAARRVMDELRKAVEGLRSFPRRGRPLDAMIAVHTEYRYLVCENYCIFYLENDDSVVVIRILHQRQECLRALFIET
ncbi:MAG: type II toxin-antitoxin system RelE/ParE family toxin [Clostridia bacterium]|nr:type II toxin-antitoxin system RelE/ParE family toxin [Clostridia bacterium]